MNSLIQFGQRFVLNLNIFLSLYLSGIHLDDLTNYCSLWNGDSSVQPLLSVEEGPYLYRLKSEGMMVIGE